MALQFDHVGGINGARDAVWRCGKAESGEKAGDQQGEETQLHDSHRDSGQIGVPAVHKLIRLISLLIKKVGEKVVQ